MGIRIVKPRFTRENFLNVDTVPDINRVGDKTILDIFSDTFLNFKKEIEGQISIPFTVTAKNVNRADLISDELYGTTEFWWLICKLNGIVDPYQDLTAGLILNVPTRNTIDSFLNKLEQRDRKGNIGNLSG